MSARHKHADVVAGLRELADFIEAHPSLPVRLFRAEVNFAVNGNEDETGFARLREIAAALGVEAVLDDEPDQPHPHAARTFGGVRYEAYYVTDRARRAFDEKYLKPKFTPDVAPPAGDAVAEDVAATSATAPDVDLVPGDEAATDWATYGPCPLKRCHAVTGNPCRTLRGVDMLLPHYDRPKLPTVEPDADGDLIAPVELTDEQIDGALVDLAGALDANPELLEQTEPEITVGSVWRHRTYRTRTVTVVALTDTEVSQKDATRTRLSSRATWHRHWELETPALVTDPAAVTGAEDVALPEPCDECETTGRNCRAHRTATTAAEPVPATDGAV